MLAHLWLRLEKAQTQFPTLKLSPEVLLKFNKAALDLAATFN